jgi:hypothetical protein
MGAFAVSAFVHHLGLWGVRNGAEFATAGGFFLLVGVGALIEGLKVGALLGWAWMIWTTPWGTL